MDCPLSSRNQLPKLLNRRKLLGTAIEIGTHQAEYAEIFLSIWKGETLYCIDPWQNTSSDYEQQAQSLPEAKETRIHDLDIAKRRLQRFGKRAVIVPKTSQEALTTQMNLSSADFVYVDGDHTEDAVFNDLNLAWSVLERGGILAGHDIICPNEVRGGWGQFIQLALTRFCDSFSNTIYVYLIKEEGGLPWSYFMIKGDHNNGTGALNYE